MISPTENALAHLNQAATPAVLARTFADAQILGARRSSTHCPVAQYLEVVTGARHSVSLDNATAVGTNWPPVPTPPVVQAFIVRFDGGEYSELRG